MCRHIASRQNHRDAVLLLLARGATFDVINSKGQTPLDCALPDSEVYSQLALNLNLREMLSGNKHRTNIILSRYLLSCACSRYIVYLCIMLPDPLV